MTPNPDYPKLLFQWHPKDSCVEIPDKLWSCIMRSNQAKVKRLRRERKPFQIVEHKPNAYTVNPV